MAIASNVLRRAIQKFPITYAFDNLTKEDDRQIGVGISKEGDNTIYHGELLLDIECAKGKYVMARVGERETTENDMKAISKELDLIDTIYDNGIKLTESDILKIISDIEKLSESKDYKINGTYKEVLRDGPFRACFLKPEEEAQLDEIRNGKPVENEKPTENNSSHGYLMDHEEIMKTTLPLESPNDRGCLHPKF